jgi:hypothetical protein
MESARSGLEDVEEGERSAGVVLRHSELGWLNGGFALL